MQKKLVVALLGILILGTAVDAYASSTDTQTQIDEKQQEINSTKEDLNDANTDLDYLEGVKEVLEVEKDSYESSIEEIVAELGILNDKITEKEQEIEETEASLEEAEREEKKQYHSMKKRIQYMYERGNSSIVEIVLESQDMGEMLSKMEYVTQITKYDRDMLNKYSDTRQNVDDKRVLLSTQQKELEETREESQRQQEAMAQQLEINKGNIAEYEGQIELAEAKALEYEEKLRRQEESLEGIKRRKAEEEAYANGGSSTAVIASAPSTVTSATDLQLLAAIIECEAGGESYTGKIAVGNVVLNRVASSRFPNNIVDVLYQRSQFTPVTSGRFVLVLARGANAACTQAAQNVLNGEQAVPSTTLFFHRVRGNEPGTIIGNHIFY